MKITIIDNFIEAVLLTSNLLLEMEIPEITADFLNTQYVGVAACYFKESNKIAFNYKYYLEAFNEVAAIIIKTNKVPNDFKAMYGTQHTIALAMLLFHEIRHVYQHLHLSEEWEKSFSKDAELNVKKGSSKDEIQIYTNLATELDAKAFSVVALAILFRDRIFLNHVDDSYGVMDREKYSEILNDLVEEFSDFLPTE